MGGYKRTITPNCDVVLDESNNVVLHVWDSRLPGAVVVTLTDIENLKYALTIAQGFQEARDQ